MSKSDITRYALMNMIFALPAATWQLRLVPDDDHPNLRVLSPQYSGAQLLGSVRFLRHKNANGYHIYGRPEAARHALTDDLCEDALDQLKADGLCPNVVVWTSKGNYQAWNTLSSDEIEPHVATAAAKLLARRYEGDPGAANWRQMGRLPGFTNRKEIYCNNGVYPWTGLARPVRHNVQPGAAMLLAEARELAASTPTSSSSTLGACDHDATAMLASDMTPVEAKAIYDQTCAELAERFNWPTPTRDRSRADFAVARNLVMLRFERADVIAVLLHGSVKSGEMNRDRASSYVNRTVDGAFGFVAIS